MAGLNRLVHPSLDMVRRNTVTRIDPLIASSPALRDPVVATHSQDAGNSLFQKSFPDGRLVMTGTNFAIGLRSRRCATCSSTRRTAIPWRWPSSTSSP